MVGDERFAGGRNPHRQHAGLTHGELVFTAEFDGRLDDRIVDPHGAVAGQRSQVRAVGHAAPLEHGVDAGHGVVAQLDLAASAAADAVAAG